MVLWQLPILQLSFKYPGNIEMWKPMMELKQRGKVGRQVLINEMCKYEEQVDGKI